MGIFTRFKDIISSNINAMLDKAEDPEKLIKLMIQEMEETLVELKSSCAGIMADRKMVEREMTHVQKEADHWQERAKLAVDKGRDDLAKQALAEKQDYMERVERLGQDITEYDNIVEKARQDMEALENKLTTAKEKQNILLQRRLRASQSLKAQKEIRQAGSRDAERRFQEFEYRIDKMEAEAGLVNSTKPEENVSLKDEIDQLKNEDSINEELQKLKASSGKKE